MMSKMVKTKMKGYFLCLRRFCIVGIAIRFGSLPIEKAGRWKSQEIQDYWYYD